MSRPGLLLNSCSMHEDSGPSQNTKHPITYSQSNDISGTNSMAMLISVNSSQDDPQSPQSLKMASQEFLCGVTPA